MKFDLMKKAAVLSVAFSVVAMGAIFFIAAKSMEAGQETMQAKEEAEAAENAGEIEAGQVEEGTKEQALTFVLGESDTSYLRIPLPEGCEAEDITIENHYMVQELYVVINSDDNDFYGENAISGNREKITQGRYIADENSIELRFWLTGIFEYHTILENNDLYVSFVSPKEMYDKIVVIDPACGGMNEGYTAQGLIEKEINLQIAEKLKEKLDKTDIKAYYTRMDDVNPDEETRAQLANETRADMYIRIQAASDDDSSVYGTSVVYNGEFFIPGFGSIELADLLGQEVSESVKGKDLGSSEAGAEEYALRQITVPAAALKAGYITNKQEAILLQREDYQEKIAEGIYRAIIRAFEDLGHV